MAREPKKSLYEAIWKRQGGFGKGLKPAMPPAQKPIGESLQATPAPKPKPDTHAEKTRIIDQKRQVTQTGPGRPDALADKPGKASQPAGAIPQQGGEKSGRMLESARQVVIKGLKKPLAAPALKKIRETHSALKTLWKGLLEDISWLWWAAITAGLIILLALVFILGMEYQQGTSTDLPKGQSEPVEINVANAARTVKTVPPANVRQTEPVKPPVAKKLPPAETIATKGTNAIVIVAYTKKDDLKHVQEYFKKNGIDTEVIQRGSYYLLVTKEWFDNPDREGTDGYRMKESIKKIGAAYKAPEGFERFGTTPFQDVYGMKMK